MVNQRSVIFSLTSQGWSLGRRIQRLLAHHPQDFGEVFHYHRPAHFSSVVAEVFQRGDCLIMICAAGIVVRTLAKVIKDKHQDPPVLVLDEKGHYVVSLLSGHEGGADKLAQQLASLLTAQAIVTSANKDIEAQHSLQQASSQDILSSQEPLATGGKPDSFAVVGVGCERHADPAVLSELAQQCLATLPQPHAPLLALATIDVKLEEHAVNALAASLAVPLVFYSAARLRAVEDWLYSRSPEVFAAVGCFGVAEAAALLHAQRWIMAHGGLALPRLLAPKHKLQGCTCAIAGGVL